MVKQLLSTADGTAVLSSNASGAIVISPVYRRPDGKADGFLNVSTNMPMDCYVVQATSDFQTWVNVSTNAANGDILFFLDASAAPHPYRFYRAMICTSAAMMELATLEKLPTGGTRLQFNREAQRTYRVQASTNLQSWVDLETLPGTGGSLTFKDLGATNFPFRFYRVRVLP